MREVWLSSWKHIYWKNCRGIKHKKQSFCAHESINGHRWPWHELPFAICVFFGPLRTSPILHVSLFTTIHEFGQLIKSVIDCL